MTDVTNTQTRPVINLEGEKVALGPLRRDLVPLYQQWNNDPVVNQTTATFRPVTYEEQLEGYERYSKDDHYRFFTIYERSTWRPVGMAYLSDIDSRNRTAEYGIVIGERESQGHGYGTETTQLVLGYGFNVLALHNILLTVYEYNPAGIRAYQKAGFREFGRRRQAKWMNGRLWDVVYMECLSSEFTTPPSGQSR